MLRLQTSGSASIREARSKENDIRTWLKARKMIKAVESGDRAAKVALLESMREAVARLERGLA